MNHPSLPGVIAHGPSLRRTAHRALDIQIQIQSKCSHKKISKKKHIHTATRHLNTHLLQRRTLYELYVLQLRQNVLRTSKMTAAEREMKLKQACCLSVE
jgi:hypothetical protein